LKELAEIEQGKKEREEANSKMMAGMCASLPG
jgi:hypothetical protein